MDLTGDEYQMLEQAAAAGGRVTIRDLSPTQMRHAADVAENLKSMSLVNAIIHRSSREAARPVDSVVVEITEEGRRHLNEQG